MKFHAEKLDTGDGYRRLILKVLQVQTVATVTTYVGNMVPV